MSQVNFIDFISWFILGFNLYSYYLICNKNKLGFIFGIIGCVLGISVFLTTMNIPLIIMNVCFLILNLKGYLQWT